MGEVGDGGAYGQTVLPCLAKDLAFLLHIGIVICGVVTRSVVQTRHWQDGANEARSFGFEHRVGGVIVKTQFRIELRDEAVTTVYQDQFV